MNNLPGLTSLNIGIAAIPVPFGRLSWRVASLRRQLMVEFLVVMLCSVLEVVLVFTGAQMVDVLSLGRWRAERQGSDEARTFGAAGALSFRHEGKRVVTTSGLWFVGLLFYAALGFLLVRLALGGAAA